VKFLDEYRDADKAKELAGLIRKTVTRPWSIMEICGGQTHSIIRFSLDELLPAEITLIHGPAAVWRKWKAGGYRPMPDRYAFRKPLRFGAYGDPAALPLSLTKNLTGRAVKGWTGYTHQWKTCDQRFSNLIMASAETASGRLEAKAKGWRTFRVVKDYAEMEAGERVCANESHGVECIDCMACHGKGNRADIAIKVHGSWGKRLKTVEEAVAAG